jgi:hypothetical protein
VITDEMVNAARHAMIGDGLEAIHKLKLAINEQREMARAALTAALPLIRGAVVEEAIEACKKQERDFLDPAYTTGQPLASFSERFACDQCARAIRAISQREAGE